MARRRRKDDDSPPLVAESIEEFMARGGKVHKIDPAWDLPEEMHTKEGRKKRGNSTASWKEIRRMKKAAHERQKKKASSKRCG